eukprot:TRINITY_DN538_c0_g1_i1.p2 TRINITY_DN538_c0_g1~~TRINITY_DN538_c0_g1_i1.p2  ORF type:complete len:167 (+),score=13.08 TRINITY_DN538_c0_g1_i1:102-602(+)
MMGCICISTITTTTLILSSLPNNNNNSKTPPRTPNPKPAPRRVVNGARSTTTPTPQKQPSVAEIERAIGAGIFRDADRRPSENEIPSFFDLLSSTPIGQPEGSAEKKLRETAERFLDRTEGGSRSGQEILMVVCLRILPVWLFFLLVASGIIKLPFTTPFLDDFLM